MIETLKEARSGRKHYQILNWVAYPALERFDVSRRKDMMLLPSTTKYYSELVYHIVLYISQSNRTPH